MRKDFPTNIILAVIIIILFLIGKTVYKYFFTPEIKFGSKELYLIDLDTKKSIDSFKGKVIIVSCFQTWCSDCAKETPILNELASKFDTSSFRVIYITDEDNAKLLKFRNIINSNNILFTTIPEGLSSIGVNIYPTTFLLNKSGKNILTKLECYNWLEEIDLIRKLVDD